MNAVLSRRQFMASTFAAGVTFAAAADPHRAGAANDQFPPVRTITHGPKHHWFGYYDKLQFDPSMRYVLGMQVDFEHRSPKADDQIKVGMVDLQDGDRWIELGTSTAWCWQQGCMLQWIPGSQSEVLWNDRQDDRYVCRILDVATKQQRTVPHPIYALSPDGATAVAADFRRINDVRPGYGYAGLADPYADDPAPKDSGIFRVDLRSGRQQLIVSLADMVRLGSTAHTEEGVKHYFNHLLFNPDGSRFVFLHRWRYPNGRRLTRMLTAAPDGSDVRIVDDNGLTSHFIWRDPGHILAFSEQPSHGRAFYLFEDGDRSSTRVVGHTVMQRDGHCSYLPGNQWILCDTYPDRNRNQMPYLYHVKTGRLVPLGLFHLPNEYRGEWRCDTHPRFSPDGKLVVIDAPQADEGRQLHLIDISKIVAAS